MIIDQIFSPNIDKKAVAAITWAFERGNNFEFELPRIQSIQLTGKSGEADITAIFWAKNNEALPTNLIVKKVDFNSLKPYNPQEY